jgi:signal peptidase I
MVFRRSHKLPRPLSALLIVLLMLAWILFAPTQLGGQTSYVIINGNSMEPLYHRGDLVILRQTDQPEIGDIFAYHYPDIGSVIHRIIDVQGNHFILKGDHNASPDGYQPLFDELIGRAWIHIPGVGNTVLLLRQPVPFALLVASLGGFLMFGLIFDSPKQPDKKKKPWLERLNFLRLPSMPDQSREGVLFGLSFVLFAAGVLAIFAFSTPISVSKDDNIEYSHLTVFRYTAPTNPQVYDRATIQSGDPVFFKLNCSLDIVVNYTLASTATLDTGGSYRMFAILSEFNGWNRRLELVPSTAFAGNTFNHKVSMDVCAIHQMVDDMVALTGLTRSTYAVSLVTQINLSGKIGNRDYQEQVSPSLNFAMDDAQLYLVRDETSGSDPLNLNVAGLIPGKREEANTISILGLKLPVLLARIIAAVGILGSLAGLVAYGLSIYRNTSQDELASVRLKYAPMLTQINAPLSKRKTSAAQNVVDVKSMADLARLAQNTGSVILEQEVGAEHHFLVLSEPYTYRYILIPIKEDGTDVAS